MKLQGLAARPAPQVWSTTGLLFLDPAVMSEYDIRPGQLAFLEVQGDRYPLRTGLPRKKLFGSKTAEIDYSIWRTITGDLRPNSFSIIIDPEQLVSLSTVHLHVDEQIFVVIDRDSLKQVVKVKGYPARQGYRLSTTVNGQVVFFEVKETFPPCGGIIVNTTHIFLGERELQSFKLIHQYRRHLDEILTKVERLDVEIKELMARAVRITHVLERSSDSQLRMDRLKREQQRLEVRVNDLVQKIDDLTAKENKLEAYIRTREED